MNRDRCKYSLAIAALVAALTSMMATPPTVRAGWTSWSCGWAVLDYYVQGGDLDGNACARWNDTFGWDVWGQTWVPTSYRIDTVMIGQDTCASSWTNQMTGSGTAYNATYGDSGSAAFGYYQSCQPWETHRYRLYYSGSRLRYSTSSWEGTYGFWYP